VVARALRLRKQSVLMGVEIHAGAFWTTVFGAGAAIALTLVWLLNHGLLIGSRSGMNIYKTCKYLFVSGIAELPAQGGWQRQCPAQYAGSN
jgi:hypothetical protein